jgi:hypothetical protein
MIYGLGSYQGIAQDWLTAPLGIPPVNDYGSFYWGDETKAETEKRLTAFAFYKDGIQGVIEYLKSCFDLRLLRLSEEYPLTPLLKDFGDTIHADKAFFGQIAWDIFTRILQPNPQKIDIFKMTAEDFPTDRYIPSQLKRIEYLSVDEIDSIKDSGCLEDKINLIAAKIVDKPNTQTMLELCRLILIAHNLVN